MSELRHKTVHGFGWGFAENMVGTGLLGLVNLYLARILTPEDFGLVGLTSVFLVLANSLVDSGFTGSLTRRKSVSPQDLDTVFLFNLLTSAGLYALLYGLAPAIARYFGEPLLVPLVRVQGVALLITAFSLVQKVLLVRRLDFRTQAIVSLAASVLAGATGIWMVLNGYGFWSLVALQLVRLGVTTLLFWVFARWRPSLSFSWRSFREMFAFGGRLMLTSLVSICWSEIYSIVIGKIYSAPLLGQYQRAEKFKNMVTSNVGMVVQRVSYPVLASVQDERERQLRIYRKILRTTVLLSFTAACGLAAVAEGAVLLLVGDQWLPSVPYLRILCLSGLFLPLILCSANVVNANGRSDYTLYLEILKTALAVIPVLLGIRFSIEAMLWGMAGVSVLAFLAYAYAVSRVLAYPVWRQVADLLPFLLISAAMAAAVYTLTLLNLPFWAELPLQLLAGAGIVQLAYGLLYRCEEFRDLLRMLPGPLKRVLLREKGGE